MKTRKKVQKFLILVELTFFLLLSLTQTSEIIVNGQESAVPIISIFSPQPITYTSSNVNLTFTISEKTSWIGYRLDGSYNMTINGNTTLSLTEGAHNITVYATDEEYRNSGKSEFIQFYVDSIAPIAMVISPTSKIYNTNNVSVILETNEEASVKYSLDRNENVTYTNSTILYDLTNRDHTLIIFTEDVNGNINSTEINFSVNYERPLKLEEIAIVALVLTVGLAPILYILYTPSRYQVATKKILG